MFKGFYSAASGMMTQQRNVERLTNNMANVNTVGFKQDQASIRSFPEMLLDRVQREKGIDNHQIPVRKRIGSLNTGAYMQELTPNFTQGGLQSTDRSTDVALIDGKVPEGKAAQKGSFFFIVEQGDEVRYTRNGNFALSNDGYLTTNDGHYVLGQNGTRISLTDDNFKVSEQGVVTQNGEVVGTIDIAFSNNVEDLNQEGNGLYSVETPLPSAIGNEEVSYKVNQGMLENSNVDSSQTMTEMMSAYRSFEANQKVMQAYDKSMEKAANEVGHIS
jgi:flagellar basal-body rod protein FlgG